MKTSRTWLLVSVVALSGCYEHRTLEFRMPDPDGSMPNPRDGGIRDDLDFGFPGPDFGFPGLDMGFGSCGTQTTVSRFDQLRIPTPSEATTGATVGHDIDGANQACNVPDYPRSVDNAFIDLATALPALSPDAPINLQMALDSALGCTAGSATCGALELDLNVNTGASSNCAQVVFTNGAGVAVSSVGSGNLSNSGELRVPLASLELTIPYPTANGPVDIPLRLRDVIVTGTVSDAGVQNIVIGGSLQKGELEATVRAILPLLSDDVAFEDVVAILQALYDVELAGGCTGLSVGLLGRAR